MLVSYLANVEGMDEFTTYVIGQNWRKLMTHIKLSNWMKLNMKNMMTWMIRNVVNDMTICVEI